MIKDSPHQPPPVPPATRHGPTPAALFAVQVWNGRAALSRYRTISLVVFALTSAAIVIHGYTKVRMFQAQGRLLIEPESSAAGSHQGPAPSYENRTYDNTQYQIIKSRDLTRRVVQTLHLENSSAFNGTANRGRTAFNVLNDLGRQLAWRVRSESAGATPPGVTRPPDDAGVIDTFISLVGVTPVPDSRLVDVTVTSIDAPLAALAVNSLMDEYVAQHRALANAAAPATSADEARVTARRGMSDVRIVDRADVPKQPMAPAGPWTWLMAVAIGLTASIGVAQALDYLNDTIKTPEDIDGHLDLPLLGLVPAVTGDAYRLPASVHVDDEFGESFRALRASVLSRYADPGTKLLLVTSAQPLEGKTMVAVNLATALAGGGGRVLLIDADLRRPVIHQAFRLPNERGLAQVLSGQARVRDVVQRTDDPNLLAITAGRMPQNPSALLSSQRMKMLLSNLAHGAFDWIVIDTPPVLAVTDAMGLAPSVDGIVFVIGAEMTRRRLAEQALATLLSARPRSVCAVLNKVDFSRNKRHRSHGYQFGSRRYPGAAVSM